MFMPELFDVLKALGDETRYRLVKLLLQHDYCVGALARQLDISESAISQHLKILRNAGIVKGEKRGYFTHYYIDRYLLGSAAKKLAELCELEKMDEVCTKAGLNSYCQNKKEG